MSKPKRVNALSGRPLEWRQIESDSSVARRARKLQFVSDTPLPMRSSISMDAETESYDVIVAGAGPVGLTLAIDLGRRGVRCLIIERHPTTAPWPKMDRSNARTMEFYRRSGSSTGCEHLATQPTIRWTFS